MTDDITRKHREAKAFESAALAMARGNVHKDPHVSLTRVNAETGETEDAFFWVVDDKVLVHPDRWDEFEQVLAKFRAAAPTFTVSRAQHDKWHSLPLPVEPLDASHTDPEAFKP